MHAMTGFDEMSGDRLRNIWAGRVPQATEDDRLAALDCYWARVARGGLPYSLSELLEALATGISVAGNAVGNMVQLGALPPADFASVRQKLESASFWNAPWALRQLEAAEHLLTIATSPDREERRRLLGTLFARDLFWAAAQALHVIDGDDVAYVLRLADENEVYGRKSRNRLREAAVRLGKVQRDDWPPLQRLRA